MNQMLQLLPNPSDGAEIGHSEQGTSSRSRIPVLLEGQRKRETHQARPQAWNREGERPEILGMAYIWWPSIRASSTQENGSHMNPFVAFNVTT
jgi:hypothetical protein